MCAKRLVIKLSGESLLSQDRQQKFCPDTLGKLIDKFLRLKNLGYQLAIVLGGGNLLRGKQLQKDFSLDRVSSDAMGMLATVINSYFLYEQFKQKEIKCKIFTASPIALPSLDTFCPKTCINALDKEYICIFGGGLGSAFFTTDSCAALRACEIQASLLVKVTHIDGIYDKDPDIYTDAKRLEEVSYSQCLKEQLNIMDATAFALCRDNKIPLIVCHINHVMEAILEGKHRTLVKGD